MPRVENCGKNVDEWHQNNDGSGSSTYDICRQCLEYLNQYPGALELNLIPYQAGEPTGSDGWLDLGNEHPDYEDEDYCCAACGRQLDEDDN